MEQNIQTTVQSVSRGRRLENYIIDIFLYNILVLFLINPLILTFTGDALLRNFWANFLFNAFILALYYFIFEAIFQKTPGKFVTGTKVVMEDGSKPEVDTIAKRSLIRVIPFDAISMYTGIEADKKDTWWHDRWTSTRVVKS
jgi:uncharacterized RDD family membrane protein YckC